MRDVLRAIVEAVERGRRGVVVTILDHRGASPGKTGQKLLLLDDGTRVGTVGGGRLEALALERAVQVLRSGRGTAQSFLVTETERGGIGSLCGGRAVLAFEVLPVIPRVLLCGAGHCAVEIGRLLAQVGYVYDVHDDRSDLAVPSRFAGVRHVWCSPIEELPDLARAEGLMYSHALLVSRGHATDRVYGRVIARSELAPWVGMLASRRKAKVVRRQWLEEDALPASFVDAVEAPVGLSIGAANPAEIAVSIVARIVQTARLHAGEGTPKKGVDDRGPASDGPPTADEADCECDGGAS